MQDRWISNGPVSFQRFGNFEYEERSSNVITIPVLYSQTHLSKVPNEIYPHKSDRKLCVMMVLQNLAEPHWIQINCNEQLLDTFMCIKESDDYVNNYRSIQKEKLKFCAGNQYWIGQWCYQPIWFNKSDIIYFTSKCKQMQSSSVILNNTQVKDLSPFLLASRTTFPPILSPIKYLNTYFKIYKVQKILSIYRYKISLVLQNHAVGFNLCKQKEKKISKFIKGDNIILCKNGEYISQFYLCNFESRYDCLRDIDMQLKCNDSSSQSKKDLLCSLLLCPVLSFIFSIGMETVQGIPKHLFLSSQREYKIAQK